MISGPCCTSKSSAGPLWVQLSPVCLTFRSLFHWRHKVHKFGDFGFWVLPKKLGQQKYRLSGFSVVGNNVSSIHQRGQKFSHQCAVSPSLRHDKTQLRGVSCRFAFVKKETKDWRACVVQWRTLMVQKIWLASASGDRVGHSFQIVRCTPSHLIDCIGLKLQISAFYSPTFEKAVCTIFALSVGWSIGWLVSVAINFSSPL